MKPILHLTLLLLLLVAASAQRAPDPIAAAVESLRSDDLDAAGLADVLPLMAQPAGRSAIRSELLLADEFPAGPLVENLVHPQLAIRLAALELLEEKAGGDFGFNPWLQPAAPKNEGPLARWQQWSGEEHDDAGSGDLLSLDQRRGYLRNLLGGDSDKSTRARRMLEADGLAAVGFLEDFLIESPALPDGSRAQIRQAQYQIVLSRAFGDQASTTARQLAFGSRDQTLSALTSLRSAGLAALPILRDFLEHPDPLIRESAIDAMLASGGGEALSIIAPILTKETDVNVIHGALRRLKDVPGDQSTKLALGFLDHDDEDLLVSAIQSCLKLVGGGERSYSSGNNNASKVKGVAAEVNTAIVGLLDDSRWRVRTAALEFIADRRVADASEKVVTMLEDPDEFVRFRAIKAAAALQSKGAPEKLRAMFLADAEMVGPVLEGFAALKMKPNREMLAKLDSYPADAKLAAIRAAEANSNLADVVLRYASDPDLDVACSALRFLAADDDRVGDERIASALLTALMENSEEKRQAVLDRLKLPASGAVDPAVSKILADFAGTTEKTVLDPLYDAFLKVDAESDDEREAPAIPGAAGKLAAQLEKIAEGDSAQAFRAALALATASNQRGLIILTKRLPKLSTAEKASIAEHLNEPSQREAIELLRQLIREPLAEIRKAAVASSFSNENAPAFTSMVFEELGRPDALLEAHELYSYSFESITRSGTAARVTKNWALSTLSDEQALTPVRVLAMVAIRNSISPSAKTTVLKLATDHPDAWLRRAAWYALGNSNLSSLSRNIDALLADTSPQVRAVLPEVTGRMGTRWGHRFDDAREIRDTSWNSSRDDRRLASDAAEALEKMARTDPSPENRFEAAFALLSHNRDIDAEAFAELISQQPEDAYASRRIAYWMSNSSAKLGPGLAPVIAALNTSEVDSNRIQTITASLGTKSSGAGFASFSALAASSEEARSAPQQATVSDDDPSEEKVVRDSLKLVYFFKPGCRECARVSELLSTLKNDFPLLVVEEHNILESDGTLLNQALCDRFGVPSREQNIAPSLFVQSGFLVRDMITPPELGGLLARAMKQSQDDSWSVLDQPEMAAAKEQVEERYESLTLPIVIGAGLLDGINPCAFATIIFFLSYLQVARRTPREMLMVGIAFILGVFIAYLAAGLALHRVLASLTEQVQGVQKWLNWIFGGLALLAAALSFRDAWIARQGRAEDMTLQLPAFLKNRIRGVIRSGARARRFVIAAFVAGLIISFLELACTGQVYAPIIYQIQQGRTDAFGMLVIYNLAFILPLVIIFIAAWAGLKSEALIRFQQRSTATVKILLGLLFLLLAVLMLFGGKWLPH